MIFGSVRRSGKVQVQCLKTPYSVPIQSLETPIEVSVKYW